MPTARSEMPAAALNGLIYTAGGLVNSGGAFNASRAFEVFDPLTDRWRQRAALRRELHHLQMAAWGGRIYVFGGVPGCVDCVPDGSAWSYDPTADTWADIAPMPDARVAGAAVALGDYLYLVGGVSQAVEKGTVSDLLRYDPATDVWTQLSPLPGPRDHVAAVAYGGKLYALGGRWDGDYSSIAIYDPTGDVWALGPTMHDARAGHGATVLDGMIYVAGGERLGIIPEQVVTTVEVLDPALNRWVDRFDLPVGLHGLSAVGLEGVLYLLGGSTRAGGVVNYGAVWAYRP